MTNKPENNLEHKPVSPSANNQIEAVANLTKSAEPVVRLRGIYTSFGGPPVHDNLDLDIYEGEILGLIGGSGTGKSVLLRTILGLNKQTKGLISIMGTEMGTASAEEAKAVRQKWGVLFQSGALFSSLTVGENIQVPIREYTNLTTALREDVARLKLQLVGLPPSAFDKYPSELSGGMRKRAGLARALALDPALLLLDEPTAGLDPLGAASFDQLILDLRDNLGLTVCMVTHDLDSLYAICGRIAVLAEKRIYAIDTIPNLLKNDLPWIQDYFTGPRGRAAAKGQEIQQEQENRPQVS